MNGGGCGITSLADWLSSQKKNPVMLFWCLTFVYATIKFTASLNLFLFRFRVRALVFTPLLTVILVYVWA